LPQRFSSAHQHWLAYEFFDTSNYQKHRCYLIGRDRFEDFDAKNCLSIDQTRPNVLLFGDSHAAQYWPGLVNGYPDIHFLQANVSGCRPLRDVPGGETCQQLRRWLFDDFLPTSGKKLDALVLAGRWHSTNIPALSETLTALTQNVDNVIVLGPIIEYSLDVPSLLVRSELHDAPGLARRHRREECFDLDEKMRSVVTDAGGLYVSVIDALCPKRNCTLLTRSGDPLQCDYGHLTVPGSIELVHDLRLPLVRHASSGPRTSTMTKTE